MLAIIVSFLSSFGIAEALRILETGSALPENTEKCF
jgi:hypothetical protein